MELLNSFSEINVETPEDKIIRQIRDLISAGQLKPGDKLPSERQLSDKLGVSRTLLRNALKKLEFFGILKALPQSGTVVAGIGMNALEGLITDMLNLRGNDFKSLVEARVILEKNSAQLAAINRTEEDIVSIRKAIQEYNEKVNDGDFAIEEDFMFHLKIAEASKNSVLKSLMLIIIPDIMVYFKENNVCGQGRSEHALEEHEMLLEAIINQDSEKAGEIVDRHLEEILEYVRTTEEIPNLHKINLLVNNKS